MIERTAHDPQGAIAQAGISRTIRSAVCSESRRNRAARLRAARQSKTEIDAYCAGLVAERKHSVGW